MECKEPATELADTDGVKSASMSVMLSMDTTSLGTDMAEVTLFHAMRTRQEPATAAN